MDNLEQSPHLIYVCYCVNSSPHVCVCDIQGDGRYLITNSKDQTIKLWDIRQFSQGDAISATLGEVQRQSWDYRWQDVPKKGGLRIP